MLGHYEGQLPMLLEVRREMVSVQDTSYVPPEEKTPDKAVRKHRRKIKVMALDAFGWRTLGVTQMAMEVNVPKHQDREGQNRSRAKKPAAAAHHPEGETCIGTDRRHQEGNGQGRTICPQRDVKTHTKLIEQLQDARKSLERWKNPGIHSEFNGHPISIKPPSSSCRMWTATGKEKLVSA